MANKSLFNRFLVGFCRADTINEAGGPAYKLEPRHALAQYAATGCFNSTFYVDAAEQLQGTMDLCREVSAEWIAKTAVYTREKGLMKDTPALLCAVLASRDGALLERIFPRVIDNGKMLRNFVQIMRSGITGRGSLGTRPRRLVRNWLNSRPADVLFRHSTGNDPSLADVVRMVHPRPATAEHEAFYAWLVGRPYSFEALPSLVRWFEQYKSGESKDLPDVPFLMLTSLELGRAEWTEIARRVPWQTLRMNLNTFLRHGVFDDREMVTFVADRLRNRDEIQRARAFPYQILSAWKHAEDNLPREIVAAMEDAMEIAVENVPRLNGNVYICLDVSGSMMGSVTGYRQGSTSKVTCTDVAALMTAAVLRQNPSATVLPFDDRVYPMRMRAGDSIMSNAKLLSALGGGGTDCSAPLAEIRRSRINVDSVIMVSDNESWADPATPHGTAMLTEWMTIKKRNPPARMVCINIAPYGTVQVPNGADTLNIGGFSDSVFDVVGSFLKHRNAASFVAEIERVEL